MQEKYYAAIDLKSFYASVECIQRGLDPLNTNLVVADPERTEKTICLAVSPSLKSFGIPGRPRLFEVVEKVGQANALRKQKAPGRRLNGSSHQLSALREDPSLGVDYIVAPPQMARYMACSAQIYEIYLKYVAPEDIHVYSVDEVFIDLTPYLRCSGKTAYEFTMQMIREIIQITGITATAGIGTNLYLCKVAMDIVAKHTQSDKNGVRIAQLDEISYRKQLWEHRPLTDFWRVGPGYARKLEQCGLYTMGDIARCSIGEPTDFYNEDLLYKLFGINAQLLIDHAWGWEPCTLAHIKAYKPESSSLSTGQVLQCPYPTDKARLIVQEMTDLLTLDLVDKNVETDQIVLTLGYDIENLTDPHLAAQYQGAIVTDHYGRKIPKHSHGTANLGRRTSSTVLIMDAVTALFDRIANPSLSIRRITVAACHLTNADQITEPFQQLDLFSDGIQEANLQKALDRERRRQKAILGIKKKYGKNAILKGMNFQEGATSRERNRQVGGHKA